MIKIFKHKFKNNFLLKLTVDLTSNLPRMVVDKKIDNLLLKDKDFEKEYKTWTNMVMKEVFRNLSKKQIKYFEEKEKNK